MIKKLLFATATLLLSQPVLAFGQNGHRIVAHIAEQNLTPQAKSEIKKLIKGVPLAKLSTWPDEIRSDEKWKDSGHWHYISVADEHSVSEAMHPEKINIMQKLMEMDKKLTSPETSETDRWQALAFYVHLVADLHQPLHVGRKEDKGGNDVKISWFGDYSNLHKVWDTDLIEFQNMSYTEYADFIDDINEDVIKQWQKSDYLDWANESKALRKHVYDLPERGKLHFEFTYQNTPVINQRLAQAGYRLAAKLNKFFAQKD